MIQTNLFGDTPPPASGPTRPKPVRWREGGARIEGAYRYHLWRLGLHRQGDAADAAPTAELRLLWIMLNPSTADGKEDDATLRMIITFSYLWGYGGLDVCNLFAYRATKPADLKKAEQPVGPDNDRELRDRLHLADGVAFAWGSSGAQVGRAGAVLKMVHAVSQEPTCRWTRTVALGFTKDGYPVHPLRQRLDLTPIPVRVTAEGSLERAA